MHNKLVDKKKYTYKVKCLFCFIILSPSQMEASTKNKQKQFSASLISFYRPFAGVYIVIQQTL